jgi:hypothetical protein
MLLQITVPGYSDAHDEVRIVRVGSQIVSPGDAARYAGMQDPAALAISGPTVMVFAHLAVPKFRAAGVTYEYYDGLTGLAEVRIRSASLITKLMPGFDAP